MLCARGQCSAALRNGACAAGRCSVRRGAAGLGGPAGGGSGRRPRSRAARARARDPARWRRQRPAVGQNQRPIRTGRGRRHVRQIRTVRFASRGGAVVVGRGGRAQPSRSAPGARCSQPPRGGTRHAPRPLRERSRRGPRVGRAAAARAAARVRTAPPRRSAARRAPAPAPARAGHGRGGRAGPNRPRAGRLDHAQGCSGGCGGGARLAQERRARGRSPRLARRLPPRRPCLAGPRRALRCRRWRPLSGRGKSHAPRGGLPRPAPRSGRGRRVRQGTTPRGTPGRTAAGGAPPLCTAVSAPPRRRVPRSQRAARALALPVRLGRVRARAGRQPTAAPAPRVSAAPARRTRAADRPGLLLVSKTGVNGRVESR